MTFEVEREPYRLTIWEGTDLIGLFWQRHGATEDRLGEVAEFLKGKTSAMKIEIRKEPEPFKLTIWEDGEKLGEVWPAKGFSAERNRERLEALAEILNEVNCVPEPPKPAQPRPRAPEADPDHPEQKKLARLLEERRQLENDRAAEENPERRQELYDRLIENRSQILRQQERVKENAKCR
jgi:hypothetical protein